MKKALCAMAAVALMAPVASEAAVDWSGDIRYRHENIDQDGKETRDRQRVRARLSASAEVAENIKAKLRLASGGDDPVSTNQTLDGGFSTKGIQLDRAYIEAVVMEGLKMKFGKMGVPFEKVSDLVWDGDLNPEGVAAALSAGAVFVNAGAFWVEERSSDDDTFLFGGQVGTSLEAGGADVTIGGSIFAYDNMQGEAPIFDATDSFGNTVTTVTAADGSTTIFYANDFTVFELFAEVGLTVGDVPVKVFGNYVVNDDAGAEDTGYLLGFKAGKAKAPGTFEVGADYRELEADAVPGVFSDSDSFGGGTNGEGLRLKGKVALAENTTLGATYFINSIDPDGADVDYNRLQIDLAVKF